MFGNMINFQNIYFYRLNSKFLYTVNNRGNCINLFFRQMVGRVKIPSNIKVFFDKKASKMFFVVFDSKKKTTDSFKKFLINLKLCEQSFDNAYKVKVFLKGVGFRISISPACGNKLTFNLGYSHKVNIIVPAEMSLSFVGGNKEVANSVIFSSKHKENLISFVSSLKKFREPAFYTGKGLVVVNVKNLVKYKLLQKVR